MNLEKTITQNSLAVSSGFKENINEKKIAFKSKKTGSDPIEVKDQLNSKDAFSNSSSSVKKKAVSFHSNPDGRFNFSKQQSVEVMAKMGLFGVIRDDKNLTCKKGHSDEYEDLKKEDKKL